MHQIAKNMKLRFSIQYGTQWGENLHVVIHFISTDGTIKRNNLLMTTDDGSYWSLETAALASAQHPIASFTYYYQVEDGDGQVIRREWTQVPRSYPFDASKSYIFPDQWRDIPCSTISIPVPVGSRTTWRLMSRCNPSGCRSIGKHCSSVCLPPTGQRAVGGDHRQSSHVRRLESHPLSADGIPGPV